MLNFFKTKTFKVASFVIAFALFVTFTASAYTFSGPTMKVGSKGGEVAELQKLVGAIADGNFGPATKAKVATWQAANGLTVDGVFGKMSMAKANGGSVSTGGTVALCPNGMTLASNCSMAPGATTGSTTTGTLTGGAGSVSSYKVYSGLNNEEVGENKSDVKVAGIEVKASSGSDLALTAVRLVFNEGTASSDFDRYAKDVTVWLGSTKLATVAATEFTDTDNWTKTITLGNGGVVKAGSTGTLYIAVSGISNLDSNDAGDTWTVDVTSVRFMDASGVVTSEDPAVAAKSFSFEKYATAANLELKITSTTGQDAINKAHVIKVHATDDTKDVPILAFTMEAKGTSDVTISKLPVNIDVTGAGNVDDVITALTLYKDGEKVGSASVSSDCIEDADCSAVGVDETYKFIDMTATIKAGQKANFVVKADFLSIADALDEGDTIAANFGETETDTANFKAKDTSNTSVVDNDITGTATGEASELRSVGINVVLVGTPTVSKSNGDAAVPLSDSGTFSITFDVTAFGADAWIDKTAPDATGGATESDLDVTGTGTLTATITNVAGSGATPETAGTNAFVVRQDTTQRFTITSNILATASGFFDVALTDLLYAATDVDGDTQYTTGLTSFKTAQAFLNDY